MYNFYLRFYGYAYNLLNPIQAREWSLLTPLPGPIVLYYSHFSCERARNLKFYDFGDNVIRNWVKRSFLRTQDLSKRPLSFFQKKKYFLNFFFLQEYCVNIFKKMEKNIKNIHRIRYTCQEDYGIRLNSKL